MVRRMVEANNEGTEAAFVEEAFAPRAARRVGRLFAEFRSAFPDWREERASSWARPPRARGWTCRRSSFYESRTADSWASGAWRTAWQDAPAGPAAVAADFGELPQAEVPTTGLLVRNLNRCPGTRTLLGWPGEGHRDTIHRQGRSAARDAPTANKEGEDGHAPEAEGAEGTIGANSRGRVRAHGREDLRGQRTGSDPDTAGRARHGVVSPRASPGSAASALTPRASVAVTAPVSAARTRSDGAAR